MSILSGFFKTKRYRKTADGYKLESNWTSGNTVELDDGNTVQNNLGAIKGITTSTSVTEEGYAADATTVAALNNSLRKLNGTVLADKILASSFSVELEKYNGKILELHIIYSPDNNTHFASVNELKIGSDIPLNWTGKNYVPLNSFIFSVTNFYSVCAIVENNVLRIQLVSNNSTDVTNYSFVWAVVY